MFRVPGNERGQGKAKANMSLNSVNQMRGKGAEKEGKEREGEDWTGT